MDPKGTSSKINDQEQSKLINSNNKLRNIKSDYFIQKFFDNIHNRKSLEIIKYNKNLQNKMHININHYKNYSEKYSSIEIEIKPMKNKYDKFINIKKEDEEYYHIYYNDIKGEEIKSTSLKENNAVSKIKIIIDYQIKSFYDLFFNCKCIESIYFKKFYRNNIINMSGMFCGCSSLIELNLTNFNTDNVTNMSGMFSGCSSLKELNLSNFNTNNVTNISFMFSGCSSLKELNLNNFKTDNVTNMSFMFSECSSLKELNLNNFYTDNVTVMSFMFSGCSLLKELNFNNFNTDIVSNMNWMFNGCSDELKLKIKSKFKKYKEETFEDYDV